MEGTRCPVVEAAISGANLRTQRRLSHRVWRWQMERSWAAVTCQANGGPEGSLGCVPSATTNPLEDTARHVARAPSPWRQYSGCSVRGIWNNMRFPRNTEAAYKMQAWYILLFFLVRIYQDKHIKNRIIWNYAHGARKGFILPWKDQDRKIVCLFYVKV